MANDYHIPNITDIINNDVGKDTSLPVHEIRRKTTPPISLFVEKRAEKVAFVKLFPKD